jgi:hypothetical protein
MRARSRCATALYCPIDLNRPFAADTRCVYTVGKSHTNYERINSEFAGDRMHVHILMPTRVTYVDLYKVVILAKALGIERVRFNLIAHRHIPLLI